MRRLFATLALAAAALPAVAAACPFCSAPSLTLSEQATQSDAVLLVEWVSATKDGTDDGREDAATTLKVREVMKGPFKAGQTVKIAGYQPAEKGSLFLLTGLGKDVIEWDLPVAFSEAAFRYLADAPRPENAAGEKVPYRDRLPYFAKFLEFPDETIANDAYGEFANAPYEDVVAAKAVYDRERVRGWVFDPKTPTSRLGLYGYLLGLCGTDADAAALEKMIVEPTKDFRIGLDGVTFGYLLLKGEPGLDLVRERKLENEHLVDAHGKPVLDENGEPVPVPFSETYSAMQAIRVMWTYGNGRIPPAKLKEAMRTLLTRPELVDLAIADLARWKDWEVMGRLAELYDDEAYQIPGIKRSIVRFLLAAEKDLPEGVSPTDADKLPAHVKEAKRHLAAIEKADPEIVASVKQFLILVE